MPGRVLASLGGFPWLLYSSHHREFAMKKRSKRTAEKPASGHTNYPFDSESYKMSQASAQICLLSALIGLLASIIALYTSFVQGG